MMRSIGLIAAMPEECRPLLRRVPGCEKGRLDSFPSFRFQLAGWDCLLVQSGIGLKRAGDAARVLLAEVRPQILISFGVAGAVNAGLAIGDVLALRSAGQLDHGILGDLLPLATFSDSAQEAMASALKMRGVILAPGTALTTRGSQSVPTDSQTLENPVLEMETFAIALAAAQAGVPLLALRGVSDNPEEPLPIDLGAVMDADGQLRAGKLILSLLQHPKTILRLNRLRQNTALAAENAVVAVMAAINSQKLVV